MATLNGTEGNDTLFGGAAADDIHGFGGNDFLQGGDGADTVLGDAGNDTLSGNNGTDWVRGGTGNDQVSGGGGQDSFAFADFGATNADVLTDFAGNWDNIQLDLSAFTALGSTGRFASGDARFRLGAAAQDADDRIIYNQATGQLWYDADGNGAGAAQLIATLSNRGAISATDIFVFQSTTPPPPGTINGTAGNDTLVGTSGPDTLNGLGGNDSLIGNAGADRLNGGDGNDTLDAYAGQPSPRETDGIDTLDGGLGNDTYIHWHGGAVVQDAGGIDTVLLNIDGEYTMPGGIENLTIVGTSNDNFGITGNELDNAIVASDAVERIFGLAGNDTIRGMEGNDSLVGGDGVDSLAGGNGNDTLVGHELAGGRESGSVTADTLDGGSGDDVYYVNFGDNIAADPDGFDEVFADTTWTLGSGLENLTIGGVDADGASAFGNELDNVISQRGNEHYHTIEGRAGNDVLYAGQRAMSGGGVFGGDGNDTLVGWSGADTLVGGSGDDVVMGSDIFGGGSDFNTVDGGAGNDTLSGSAGSEFNDTFVFSVAPGTANADTITGFESGIDEIRLDALVHANAGANGDFVAGDARFHAAAGANSAHDADDRVIFDTSTGQLWYDADGIGGAAAQLIATIQSGTVVATDIEILNGGTTNGTAGDDSLVGTEGSDTINGFGGNDTIDGLEGADRLNGGDGHDVLDSGPRWDTDADTLDGGLGDDTYYVGPNDVILPDPGGIDWVFAHTSWTLGAEFENLGIVFDADGADAIGNDLDNIIDSQGQEHYGVIDGKGGNDRIFASQKSMSHGAIFGGDGNDTISASAVADDRIFGGAGNDYIVGYDSFRETAIFDSIDGGTGNDTIDATGTFVYSVAPGAANADTLVHFTSGVDTIELDGGVHLSSGPSGAFVAGDARFHTGTAAHDADDRVIFDAASGRLWYDADGNGAGAAQLIATVQSGGVAGTDIRIVNGSTTPPPPPGTNGTESNDTMFGTSGSDTLNGLGGNDFMQGGDGADTIRGGAGNDTMSGNGGNDWVEGGAGNDRLTGGSGQDAFVFREFGAANADTLTDFAGNGWDNMRFDNAAFTALGADGRFGSGDARFRAGTAAADADDRIVWNSATGQVWYDADGNGAGAAQLVATLQAGATLVASDIWVV